MQIVEAGEEREGDKVSGRVDASLVLPPMLEPGCVQRGIYPKVYQVDASD